jgi:hypothetical protein
MANYKRGKCRYQGKAARSGLTASTTFRKKVGLKPAKVPHWRDRAPEVDYWPGYWGSVWLGSWPRWHDIIFHSRPRRRAERRFEHAVLRGADADDLAWPLSKRPHEYYW